MMNNLKANIFSLDISPLSHHLQSIQPQFKGTNVSRHVSFSLKARIILLESNGVGIAIICLDCLGAEGDGKSAVATLRRRISDDTGIPYSNVLLSCSHSHSAISFGPSHKEWTDWAMEKVVESTRAAWQQRRPAKAGIGYGYTFEISFNQRLPYGGNHTKFVRNYVEGRINPRPIDPRVGVLRIDEISGELMGALVNFAAHPATLIGSTEISPDYPGFMAHYVETKRPGSHIAFLQGACGDININYMFTTLGAAEYTGTLLGKEVDRVLDDIATTGDFPIDVLSQKLSLPLEEMPTEDELDEWQKGCEEFLEDSAKDPTKLWVNGMNITEYFLASARRSMVEQLRDWPDWVRKNREQISKTREISYELTTIRFGELLAFFHPWELFVEIGLEIQRLSPVRHTWTIGYTNGGRGYMLTAEEHKRGGYERYSKRYGRDLEYPLNLAEQSEKIFIEQVLAAGRKILEL